MVTRVVQMVPLAFIWRPRVELQPDGRHIHYVAGNASPAGAVADQNLDELSALFW
jgi:hypothetical protein